MQLALLPPGFNLTVQNGDSFSHGEPLHGVHGAGDKKHIHTIRTHHYEVTVNQTQKTLSCRYTSALSGVYLGLLSDQHFPLGPSFGPQSHTNCILPAAVLQGFDLCRRLVAGSIAPAPPGPVVGKISCPRGWVERLLETTCFSNSCCLIFSSLEFLWA